MVLNKQTNALAEKEGDTNPRGKRRAISLGVLIIAAAIGTFLFFQHIVNRNFAVVVPDKVYRSAQPDAQDLRQWSKQYGLKTVINLRGSSFDGYDEYAKTIKELGLNLVTIQISDARPPPAPMLDEIIDALENSSQPMLIHCRSGINRAGMASALAQMAIGGESYRDAMDQRAPWSKNKSDDDGYLGTVFDDYETWQHQTGQPTGSWLEFRQWAVNEYHPLYYRVSLEHDPSIRIRPGQDAQLSVKITNRSKMSIPIGQPDRKFEIKVYQGDWETNIGFGLRTPLPPQDLPPGQSVTVVLSVTAPKKPGVYHLNIDLIEKGRSYFGKQGSVVTTLKMQVIDQ